MAKVVVAGHICLDVIPDLSEMHMERPGEFYTPGALKIAKPAKISTGGPVSNTGLNLTKLGIETLLMGKVGDDAFGNMAQLLLKKEWGIENTLIIDDAVSTSYTVVINPKGFDRMFIHDPGANNTFRASDIDYDQVAQCDLFHFGYPPLMKQMIANDGKELIEMFRRVHELGVTTSLDMCLPDCRKDTTNWPKIFEGLCPHLDLYLGSAEETLFMLHRDRYMALRNASDMDLLHAFTGDMMGELSGELLEMGVRVVVIKSGSRGYYVRTPATAILKSMGKAKPGNMDEFADREIWHPAFFCPMPLNATGSGDASISGFLSAYLRGLPLLDCVITATATGSASVEKPDALSGVPDWAGMQQRIKTIPRDPLTVTGTGWNTDAEHPFLWVGPFNKSK
ncbi:MAG: carbohydrate kinase family protein [Kiritimatiellales bacterium]|nr:carbohydrate kinase family protein [Kiritimatiellales bacterium]